MISKNIKLVKGVLNSLVEDSKGLVVMDFGCGKGVFAEYLKELGHKYIGVDIDRDALEGLSERGFTTYHPDNLPKDLAVDILLLGNMKGIETGMHLINARKLLTDGGVSCLCGTSPSKDCRKVNLRRLLLCQLFLRGVSMAKKKVKAPWYKRLYVSVGGSMEESFGDFAPFFTAMFFILGAIELFIIASIIVSTVWGMVFPSKPLVDTLKPNIVTYIENFKEV